MTQHTQEPAAKPQGERTIRKRRSATNPGKTNLSKVNRIKVTLKRKHVPFPQKGEQGQRELPQQATISSIIGKRTRPSTQGRRRLQQPARKYHFEEAPLLYLSEAKASRRTPRKLVIPATTTYRKIPRRGTSTLQRNASRERPTSSKQQVQTHQASSRCRSRCTPKNGRCN